MRDQGEASTAERVGWLAMATDVAVGILGVPDLHDADHAAVVLLATDAGRSFGVEALLAGALDHRAAAGNRLPPLVRRLG